MGASKSSFNSSSNKQRLITNTAVSATKSIKHNEEEKGWNEQRNIDIDIFENRLNTFLTIEELKYCIQFCNDEDFTTLDDIEEDLEVFGDDDSAIIDAMKKEFKWNETKIEQFVNIALNRKNIIHSPITKTLDAKQREYLIFGFIKKIHRLIPTDIINIILLFYCQYTFCDFVIPQNIMIQKETRSINDIIMCLQWNNISNDAISKFKQFCKTQQYEFVDLENNLIEIKYKFNRKHGDVIKLFGYIEKCIYELSPPLLSECTFGRMDEDNKYDFFQKQCKGLIKFDRDLLQYFLITEHTENGLSSELIDITDRINYPQLFIMNTSNIDKLVNGYLFRNLDERQQRKIKDGLRKYYHKRYMPLLARSPLHQIADKISGYQKYCISLSLIIDEITKSISVDTMIPFMIDLMIMAPGCFNLIQDANRKIYDGSGPLKIGDIKKRLKDYDIPIYEIRGLNDKSNDFHPVTIQGMIKNIIESIKILTNNFTKKNQRICILVDRRWRINCKKFDVFKKLRYSMNNINDTYSYNYQENKPLKNDFYNNKYDMIYVYQPNLQKHKKTSYHEFNDDFCHETLIYLTKQCIIPRIDHYMHIGGDYRMDSYLIISAHIKKPKNKLWYKYEQRWYTWSQGSSLRFYPEDMVNLWPKYFYDADQDTDKLTYDEIKKLFAINLQEADSCYKRWYFAIKLTNSS